MNITKTISTKYDITLNHEEVREAVLAYIRDQEDIDLSEAEELEFNINSSNGGFRNTTSVTIEAVTEETE